MASKKFTDLPVATEADGADILAIVDVSTDTSKQITKENFYKNLIPQGEYEPVVTGLVNLDDVALISAWYIDFGDFVKVDLSFEAQFSTGENQGEFNITFPNDANPSKVHLVCGTGLISLRIDVNGLVQIETGTGDTQRFDFTVTYKKA